MFKFGDKVINESGLVGIVIDTEGLIPQTHLNNSDCPIIVKFKEGGYTSYASNGEEFPSRNMNFKLSPYQGETMNSINKQPVSEHEFKVGDIVKVKPGLDCPSEKNFTIGGITNLPRGIRVIYNPGTHGFFSKYELEFVSRPIKKVKKMAYLVLTDEEVGSGNINGTFYWERPSFSKDDGKQLIEFEVEVHE